MVSSKFKTFSPTGSDTVDAPGLYVHVPFCRSKCPYCDFYSLPSLSFVPQWREALFKEAALYRERFPAFDTIYLGGGTPSLLDARDLATLLQRLSRTFAFSPATELTIECNPDDITPEKLASIADVGCTRINLGVQSFNDRELAFLRRRHTTRQSEKALEMIHALGFAAVSVDLMYGLPIQSESDWIGSLERALEFQPEHLSCYRFTIEAGTPFGELLEAGHLEPLGEERQRALFLLTSRLLEDRGYQHYEVTNFSRGDEHVSRHNSKYWSHSPYLGLGPSAHSFQSNERWWNVSSVEEYCRALSDGKTPVGGNEHLTNEQLQLESLYLGFRRRKGLDRDLIRSLPASGPVLGELQRSGLVRVEQDRVVPTREGLVVADSLPLLFV